MSFHLVVALSSHGFGHIGQTAPIVVALQKQLPGLRVTIRSNAPTAKLLERFGPDIDIQQTNTDVGMIQASALQVSESESADAYRDFHTHWEDKVAEEAAQLSALNTDLLLANVPYLALAGAKRANIPAIAMCSLNWADIYKYYFLGSRPEAENIFQQILAAYQSVRMFLQLTPAMAMPDLQNTKIIDPVAQLGENRRNEIARQTRLRPEQRLVMLSLGGMDLRLPVNNWPRQPELRFIVPTSWHSQHPDTIDLECLQMPFADILASCDALIAKPGYGSFVEAACLGIPVLYLQRKNWPETDCLVDWLKQHGRCAEIQTDDFATGNIANTLETLCVNQAPEPPLPMGVEQATQIIVHQLSSTIQQR
ncbi:MAG: hypothetical protein L3J84_09700 [Gammaproteobacteria bacterium]|nr:hypothetical protein [Gammaproteobacteria bacterium]